MEETYLLNHPGVKKKILNGGQGRLPHFPKGTKLVFHFQTLLDDFERTVIDDSRKNKHPTEIFVGKMFKMEVWEVLLTSMRIGEVAEFWCDATHTGLYPIVSKGIRLIAQGKDPLEGQKHMCGVGNVFHYHSTGFPELDELMRTPQPLIFIMELIQVGDPFSYQRESWMMEKDEKLKVVPKLHYLGNTLVKQGRFREAAEKYQEAVVLLRTVQSREMPGDEDYINLGRLIIPLVLNYCQCMLELEEYYEVIEHTTELLEKHKDCVKAYYKRAKAYAAVWSEKEARKDFQRVANLDITLSRLVHRELNLLSERMKEKNWEDKERYWNILKHKQENEPEEEEKDIAVMHVKEESPGEHSQTPEEVTEAEEEMKRSAAKENKHDIESEESDRRTAALTKGKDWQQMLRLIMLLQDEGNFNVKEHRYTEASAKFKDALEYIDHLQTKVEHKGEDWESLEKVRLPLCLNLSQCKLELREYCEVVELNTKLLKKHKENLKAVYQRARAHSALCDEDEARRDFNKVLHLDPKFKPIVKQEIKMMCDNLRAKCIGEKKNYWTSSQEKLQANSKKKKKAKREEGKMSSGEVSGEASPQNKGEGLQTSDGFSRSEESSRVEEGNKDEGQEKKNSQNKEESSLTPSEEKGKTDNKAVDEDSDSVQNNAEGETEDRQRSEIDSGVKKLN
ncbi:Aryl-hydrocarbon-interacting protein-like 1 [Triplophysa tibetana]|uniref:Aryl-hydrocarbon-interacting protein-like 1 n=1 Tax=Triplophysa tibetana TaxID=1572043 RepID=A0A5A9NMT2_9TELE|nr:Aryl-hydrocarbon-interacting protein-like 1 [Triplophysa tibetana]